MSTGPPARASPAGLAPPRRRAAARPAGSRRRATRRRPAGPRAGRAGGGRGRGRWRSGSAARPARPGSRSWRAEFSTGGSLAQPSGQGALAPGAVHEVVLELAGRSRRRAASRRLQVGSAFGARRRAACGRRWLGRDPRPHRRPRWASSVAHLARGPGRPRAASRLSPRPRRTSGAAAPCRPPGASASPPAVGAGTEATPVSSRYGATRSRSLVGVDGNGRLPVGRLPGRASGRRHGHRGRAPRPHVSHGTSFRGRDEGLRDGTGEAARNVNAGRPRASRAAL